ncbi:type II toxin-antitoxin system Phd/YefM family antitoxin [Acaryochloris sp. CCMEE 5410]|uniref:type II toxin-antitoxin system Phd/YefM family antitoxin n=1 Tax=Acaryochloris sp. CCMEE 5410 TaxID=310037 RepID=UPI0002484788|nr:type II toxin-antitoxin system Phd/YefM family antitoxin [Acaryochloris sp. CCMEE 5410]KAI9130219.1 type II toxin-antitoxin system Phd/YefM family antitoxin [Acaryochloris sp. CCMEE 5410]KAI9131964.1 type II toxin-antitoxin system Phd/YefM family antitoxin [Acaryochloris sp. CCMEE 5410]
MPDATILSITEASQTLSDLVDQVNESHEPIMIASAQGNAVLVSEQIWNALQETLYLNSIPGVWDSIEVGIQTPLKDCSDTLAWADQY